MKLCALYYYVINSSVRYAIIKNRLELSQVQHVHTYHYNKLPTIQLPI